MFSCSSVESIASPLFSHSISSTSSFPLPHFQYKYLCGSPQLMQHYLVLCF